MAVDSVGNVYVAENPSCAGFAFSPYGQVAVFKEALQSDGSYTQTQIGSGLGDPLSVAVDAMGNVYVVDEAADYHHGFVAAGLYQLTPSGNGYAQAVIGGPWDFPTSVAVDATGNVFAADQNLQTIYRLSSISGTVKKTSAFTPPTFENLLFPSLAIDQSRNLYFPFADIQKVGYGQPSEISFDNAGYNNDSSDSPHRVTVSNFGTEYLRFSGITFPRDFPEGKKSAKECTRTTVLSPDESCTLTIDFKPAEPLVAVKSKNFVEAITVTTNTLKSEATSQKIPVLGTEVRIAATPVFSPVSGTTFSTPGKVAITDTTPGAHIYWTNDGSDPKPPGGANLYTGPITVNGSWTFKAVADAPGYVQSDLAVASYTYN